MAENKKLYSLIVILAVCLAIVGGLYINSAVTAENSEAKQGNSTISVSGTGAIETEPNQAKVCLGVETQSKNVTEALDENSLRMTAVIEAMKALGISKDNIETTYFNI